jgi:hypothetical protein
MNLDQCGMKTIDGVVEPTGLEVGDTSMRCRSTRSWRA